MISIGTIKCLTLRQNDKKGITKIHVYLYKRADMVSLKDHMTQCKDAYLSEDHSHTSVNNEWVKFKRGFVDMIEAIESFIPSKLTKTIFTREADSDCPRHGLVHCICGFRKFCQRGSNSDNA